MSENMSEIEILCRLQSCVLIKPPQRQLDVYLELKNPGTQAQMILVPSILNPTVPTGDDGIYCVNGFTSSDSSCELTQLYGSRCYWAILLDGESSVSIDHLPIVLWPDESTQRVDLEIVFGSDIEIESSELSQALERQKSFKDYNQIQFSEFKQFFSVSAKNLVEIGFKLRAKQNSVISLNLRMSV